MNSIVVPFGSARTSLCCIGGPPKKECAGIRIYCQYPLILTGIFTYFLEFPPFPGKVPVVVHKIFVGMPNGHVFVNDSASASLSASEKLNKSGIECGDSGIAKN